VCFISNGFFPSIATYSSLPFGNTVYHLSATLHAMANPVNPLDVSPRRFQFRFPRRNN
jgi:riboflavin transporter 2